MKTCTKCKVEKNLTKFHKQARSIDGHRPHCKKCTAISQKECLIKNKERLANLPKDWSVGKTKICTQCLATKELKEFHKQARSKDGYRFNCKKCTAISQKERSIKNKERLANLPKDWSVGKTKTCYKCKVEKELTEFSKDAQNNDGRTTLCKKCKKAYTEANKEIIYAYAKEYRNANKESKSSYMKKWRKNNPEYMKSHSKIYREDNPEYFISYRQTNKEAILASAKNYRETNKDSRCAQSAKRRADLLQATPPWADLVAITEFYIKRSQLTEDTGVLYHVDHIVPLKGKNVRGLHCENNLRVIPASENLKKHNKLLI